MTVILPEKELPTGVGNFRWSSVRSCPRKAVYEAQRVPARERTRTEQGYMWRGRQLGRDFAIILAAEERKRHNPYRIKVASGLVGDWPRRWVTADEEQAAFIVEEPVRWPLGVLHPDIHVVATDTLIEVLSSSSADEAQVGSKMLQLVGQMHYSGAANGAVVVVNPSNPLDYDVYPITQSSPAYGELVEEVTSRVKAIEEWRAGGPLPARVCSKPSDAGQHFCRLADHCFADWTPPEPDVVLTTGAAAVAAGNLLIAKREERMLKVDYDAAMARRRQAEQEIAELVDTAGNPSTVRIANVDIRRIVVADHESLDLKKARVAGEWTSTHDEMFATFLRVGGGHVRWMVDVVDEEPAL